MRRPLALASLLLACVVPYPGPSDPYAPPPPAHPPAPPPPAPAPQQRRLGRDEAVQIASGHAARRGLQPIGVRKAKLDEGRWKVELVLAGGGRARVVIDAWSGAEVRLKVKGRGERRHRDRDDEDEDD